MEDLLLIKGLSSSTKIESLLAVHVLSEVFQGAL